MEFLLAKKMDICAQDRQGRSALMIAVHAVGSGLDRAGSVVSCLVESAAAQGCEVKLVGLQVCATSRVGACIADQMMTHMCNVAAQACSASHFRASVEASKRAKPPHSPMAVWWVCRTWAGGRLLSTCVRPPRRPRVNT